MSTLFADELIRGALNEPLGNEPPPAWATIVARAAAVAPDDLLSRERPQPRRWSLARRRPLIAALVIAVLIAPPAYAYGGALIRLITGSAPPSVSSTFAEWNLIDTRLRKGVAGRLDRALGVPLPPELEVSKIRGVVELQTPQGNVTLWEAPQAGGGQCWVFDFDLTDHARFDSTRRCDGQPVPAAPIDFISWIQTPELPNLVIVDARVRDVASAELHLPGGGTQAMTLAHGHAVATVNPSRLPDEMIARNAAGTIVATGGVPLKLALAFCRSHPPRNPGPASCQGLTPPANARTGASGRVGPVSAADEPARWRRGLITVGTGHWLGVTWQLQAREPIPGTLCTTLTVNGIGGGLGCQSPIPFGPHAHPIHGRGARGFNDVSQESGTSLHAAAVHGEVIAQADTVVISFSNHTQARVAALHSTGKLPARVAYFAAPVPCGASITSIAALGKTGQTVATWGAVTPNSHYPRQPFAPGRC